MRARVAALLKLRSNNAAHSNNVAIWRPARPLYRRRRQRLAKLYALTAWGILAKDEVEEEKFQQ
jgi:hypothetical protein